MKKNRLRALILVVILAVLLITGCNGTTDEEDNGEEPNTGESKKFALFMSHMSNAFTMELSGAVKEKAEELGVQLAVNDGGNDVAKQISQIETAISQGIEGIIIEAISVDGIKPAVEAAKNAGVPVVTVNQKITQQELADSFVGVSYEEGGELQMTKVIQDIGSKGNIAILLGPMGSDAQLGLYAGYEKVLKENTDINIAFEQSANWKKDEALKLSENWLQTGTQIHAIVAQNDGMALGALKAVKDAQLEDKINVYGLDAVPDALKAVKDGSLKATVSQSTKDQGTKAMETCYKVAMGESVESEIMVEHTLITIDNVEDFIEE